MNVLLKDLVSFHNFTDGLVIDCGGYKGDYTAEILKRFDCQVVLFEPVSEFAEICRKRFRNENNIRVIEKAVGKSGKVDIYKRGEGSSQFRNWAKSSEKYEVPSVSLVSFLKSEEIHQVDILKLNCEGAEYEIIRDLDKNDCLKNIREILVQFHKVGEDIEKYRNILNKTHQKIYGFKWDLWIKKNV